MANNESLEAVLNKVSDEEFKQMSNAEKKAHILEIAHHLTEEQAGIAIREFKPLSLFKDR